MCLFRVPQVADESGFSVVGNLIHEARHADDLRYLHKACTGGPNVGQGMCDDGLSDSFSVGGPHPVTLLYFAWAATSRSNWPAEHKKGLRDLCIFLMESRTNSTEEQRAAWKAKYLVDF